MKVTAPVSIPDSDEIICKISLPKANKDYLDNYMKNLKHTIKNNDSTGSLTEDSFHIVFLLIILALQEY